jgi:hypothetical protein
MTFGKNLLPQSKQAETRRLARSVILKWRLAESYLLSIHIIQPATITPPTNIAKQYRP